MYIDQVTNTTGTREVQLSMALPGLVGERYLFVNTMACRLAPSEGAMPRKCETDPPSVNLTVNQICQQR